MKITNTYKKVDNNYVMPSASTVQYFIKDAKLSGWLKKDISSKNDTINVLFIARE